MKKTVLVLILVLCFIFVPFVSYAEYDNANGNIIDGTQIVNEDLGDDKQKIIDDTLQFMQEMYNDYDVVEDDIDFSRAVKGNFNMPFIENDELTLADMIEFSDNEDTMYNIPINNANTDDFMYIDILKDNSGHWGVNAYGADEYKSDYVGAIYELLDDYKIKNSSVYFVNCIGNLPEIVLVVFRENSETAEFIVVDDLNINSKKELEFIPNTELGKRTYTYNEIKQFGAEYEMNHDSSETLYTGYSHDINNNFQYALIAGGAVLGLCAAALIINLATKKRAKV